MLRAALVLAACLTACLAAATPVGAQSDLRELGGLRGAQSVPADPSAASAAQAPPAAGVAVLPAPGLGLMSGIPAALPPPPPPLPSIGYDSDQCRSSCARGYYFCLSTERADDCPGAWGQCRARCEAPAAVSPG